MVGRLGGDTVNMPLATLTTRQRGVPSERFRDPNPAPTGSWMSSRDRSVSPLKVPAVRVFRLLLRPIWRENVWAVRPTGRCRCVVLVVVLSAWSGSSRFLEPSVQPPHRRHHRYQASVPLCRERTPAYSRTTETS